MLLESNLNDRTTLIIDAESVGGIDKGALTVQSHPDKIVPRAIEMIKAMADQLGSVAKAPGAPEMEVSFAVRVDSNSIVSIARTTESGQLLVTLRWKQA